MEKLVFSYPTNLSKEEIEYILKYVDNSLYLINLKENLKSNDWDKETRSYVENLTKDVFDCEVDFNTAIIILDNLLKEKEHVNIFLVFAALKAIIRNILDDDSICIYLIDDDSIHGCANEQDNTIKLSYSTLSNLVNGHKFEKETDIIKIRKKDLEVANKKIKKILKDNLKDTVDNEVINKIKLIFKNVDDPVKLKKINDDICKVLNGSYQRQLLENADIKILVKDTTLINGVKEQSDRYLFTLENSRLYDEKLEN
jgi:hypothetical protein